ncbi:hypothetical protein K8Z61_02275 [Nocardioides sp. TRM66260-LWL]|uniref:hypothetical protein n=1 Tax=Nocardioides sp. TRM66260-LWL TaxID=2874478 RepID=UPI001CC67A2A|nr:hypothetical protein [Nocardioides sp. TRM66260-LWL]MBZ5733311.1 hypothetical protein [Nocardioides sp. TRM66260-LWL]
MADAGDEQRPASDDDAWRAIVENFGERARLESHEEPDGPVGPRTPDPAPSASLERLFQPWRAAEWDGEPAARAGDPDDDADDAEDRFVPPPPPPLPRPTPDRLIAWVGVLGAPLVLLATLLARITLPQLLAYALVGWFIGGFLYLVVQMPREPREPWDDGAQV